MQASSSIRLLITGICGFVGSTLARRLRELKEDVCIVGIDNLSRPGSERNLAPLRALGIQVIVGDLRLAEDLDAVGPVDWVIDAAANPSVLAGVDGSSPATLLNHNLLGTIHLLEFCRKYKATFTLLSTSRVYSIPTLSSVPVKVQNRRFVFIEDFRSPEVSSAGLTEQFSTKPPISLYGNSKLCSELLALEYGESFDFPVWINRCGVLAGPGQFGKADQGIFAYWIHSWFEKRPLKYLGFGGLGHQVRDCLHPQDLAPLLLKQFYHQHQPVETRVIHVSGGEPSAMSLLELSDWCTDRMGPHEVMQDGSPRPFDLPWLILDSQQAMKLWDWSPETPRDSILEAIHDHAIKNPAWIKISLGQ